jgi:hypothetical protein
MRSNRVADTCQPGATTVVAAFLTKKLRHCKRIEGNYRLRALPPAQPSAIVMPITLKKPVF